MSYLDWHVGMKVVCVDTWVPEFNQNDAGPVAGSSYTIREIGYLHNQYPGDICVRLEEIKNPKRNFPYYQMSQWECCFGAFRFRPVKKRKTDISIFTAMLTGSREGVLA